jgi:aminopeptidase
MDRQTQLAKNLVNYSCKIKNGENVLIEARGIDCAPLARKIIKEVYKAGGVPFTRINDSSIQREILLGASKAQWDLAASVDCALMEKMQAYIGIGAYANKNELADVPSEKMRDYGIHYGKPVHEEIRVRKTKWVVLRYPNASMAQDANMSMEAFEDFYYNVCNLDYSKMSAAMDSLTALMDKTDNVRIIGPGTDLRFSIKDIPSIKCAGELNIPDGEVFTAPVRESVNGKISFNTPSIEEGFEFNNICLEFKDGKIINAAANDNKRINDILDADEGARYVGEFAIGVNPYVTVPMKDTLFDEKICGSFHFTPGMCYDEAPNGNKSSVHWDLVCIQTPEFGGGEIYFDDVLIRKDGLFTIPELYNLNPDNLK